MRTINGIEEIRLQHNLDSDSLVVEVGGWTGNFSNEIINKYNCNILIFEPLEKSYSFLKEKYRYNPKVEIIKAGIENFTGTGKINICEDGSSLYREESAEYEEVVFIDINTLFNYLMKPKIDLMELNCEGSEYNILNKIDSNLLKKINRIQIQFHDIPSLNTEEQKYNIREKLKITHNQLWEYSWFECWELKND